MKFSIITASFNPGDKLLFTVNSILEQEFQDFEIIVKDGGSKDGALELLKKNAAAGRAIAEGKLMLIIERDRNVYDGMNQALEACRGEYVLFLNCGDRFHDRSVLGAVAGAIGKAAQTVEKQTEKVSSDITGETGDAVEEQYGEKKQACDLLRKHLLYAYKCNGAFGAGNYGIYLLQEYSLPSVLLL